MKNEPLRQSKWSRAILREDQIVYAAKDAWAGSLVMQALNKLAYTHRKPTSQELSTGIPVRLSARTSNKIIGYGRIVEKVADDDGATDDGGTGRSKRRKTAEAFIVEVAHVTIRGALRPDGQQVMDDVSVGDKIQWALCSLRLSTEEELAEIKTVPEAERVQHWRVPPGYNVGDTCAKEQQGATAREWRRICKENGYGDVGWEGWGNRY